MTPFERALSIVLGHEGGDTITDDPRDAGGLTKWGISQVNHPTVDVRNLTREGAAAIYRADYWDPCQCDELPAPVALCVFDSAVNQGIWAAARMLQAAVGAETDGKIGPKTLAAVARYPVGALVRRFMVERAHKYISLGGFAAFGRGWIARTIAVTVDAIEWAHESKPAGGTTGEWHGITDADG